MDVYSKCLDIIKDKSNLTYIELDIKWLTFKNKYPQLYTMLTIEDTIDLKMLKFMCDMSEKQKKLNKEEIIENEFEVGDVLANKFLYNKFPEPNNEQKESIKENLRKKLS